MVGELLFLLVWTCHFQLEEDQWRSSTLHRIMPWRRGGGEAHEQPPTHTHSLKLHWWRKARVDGSPRQYKSGNFQEDSSVVQVPLFVIYTLRRADSSVRWST